MVPKALILGFLLLPTAAAGLDEAVAWMHEGDPTVLKLAAVHAAGVDTGGWYGAFAVPENDATGRASVRALHAVASSGYDPRTYPDPERGVIDLQQQLLDNHAGIMEHQRAADVAWHMLGLHAAGLGERPEMREAGALLASMQQGGFPCNQDDIHPDCTGFAVAALAVAGVPFDAQAVLDAYVFRDGAYTMSGGPAANTDTQAWAIIAIRNAGGQVPAPAWGWLEDQQLDVGAFKAGPGEPGPAATWWFPTSDAMLALSDFPGPSWVDVHVTRNGAGWCLAELNATWTWAEGQFEAPCIDHSPPGLRLLATGHGVHARIMFDAPEADASAPVLVLPLLLIGAALRVRAGWAESRLQTGLRSSRPARR